MFDKVLNASLLFSMIQMFVTEMASLHASHVLAGRS